jgi:TetR/AcrR family transcriptional regulator, transcriptional repressor for nem operon
MSQREAQKSQTRHEIVQSALRLLKMQGIADTSVADVMADAGLTVGGFYAHFPSKEALAEEVVRQGLQERRAMYLGRPDQEGWLRRLQSALEGYFSPEHRDDIAGGCPMPMAATDAARSGSAAAVFVKEFEKMADAFECGRDPTKPRAPREAALGSLALMVGGLILARAAKGTALSDEILEAAQTFGDAALNSLVRDDQEQRPKQLKKTQFRKLPMRKQEYRQKNKIK